MTTTQTHARHSTRRTIAGAALGLVAALFVMIIFGQPSPARSAATANLSKRAELVPLADAFGLLRTAPSASPSPTLRQAITQAPVAYGLDLQAARRSSATGAWLIPGNGWLCIAAEDREGLGVACTTARAAEADELALVERSATTGDVHIAGAMPDGTSTVTALGPSAERLAAGPVRENTYALSAPGAERITAG